MGNATSHRPPPPPEEAAAAADAFLGYEDLFKKETPVEVRSFRADLRGSWHRATVVRHLSRRAKMIFVEFDSLSTPQTMHRSPCPLRDAVSAALVRPVPPSWEPGSRVFRPLDAVDAVDGSRWWEATVEAVHEERRCYEVCLLENGSRAEFSESMVRPHVEWVGGQWVEMPPWERKVSKWEMSVTGDCRERGRWEPPPGKGIYKVNIAAAECAGLIFGLGFVTRDWEGTVVASGHKQVQLQEDDLGCAKLHAAIFGLKFTIESGLLNIILETDSLSVIDDIKSWELEESEVSLLVENIFEISEPLTTFYLSCVSWEANTVAHHLAQRGCSTKEETTWRSRLPPGISRFLVNDV